MRNKVSNLLWGLALIVVGIGFIGNAFDVWDFRLFFDGWWTLFIIVPCLISIFRNGFKAASVIGLVIGILLLLSAQDILAPNVLGMLIIAAVLIVIGLEVIFRDTFNKRIVNIQNFNKDGIPEYVAIFSGHKAHFTNEVFNGASITAIFGGAELNLRGAIIDQDVVINVTVLFGGADIIVPPNVKVKSSSVPIFGGVSNKSIPSTDENAPTVYVNATCMFGGVDIK